MLHDIAKMSKPEDRLMLEKLAQAVAELPVITDDDLIQAGLIVEQNPDTQTWLVCNDRDSIVNLPTRAAAMRAGMQLLARRLHSSRCLLYTSDAADE